MKPLACYQPEIDLYNGMKLIAAADIGDRSCMS